MTKTDIKRQLEAASGKSFLCVSEIARHMGMGRGSAASSCWRDWIMCRPDEKKISDNRCSRAHCRSAAQRIGRKTHGREQHEAVGADQ